MKSLLTVSSFIVLFLLVGALLFAAGGFRERLLTLEGRVTTLESGTISEAVVRRRPGGSALTEVRLTTGEQEQAPTATDPALAGRVSPPADDTEAIRASLNAEAVAEQKRPVLGQAQMDSRITETKLELLNAFNQLSLVPTKSPVSFPTHGYSYVKNDRGYLFFSVGGAEFSDSAISVLTQLANKAKSEGATSLVVSSYNDSSGAERTNEVLARERALLVGQALKTLGAPGELTLNPLGAASPRYSNDTPIGRMKNRRVEVVIKSEG